MCFVVYTKEAQNYLGCLKTVHNVMYILESSTAITATLVFCKHLGVYSEGFQNTHAKATIRIKNKDDQTYNT